MTHSPKHRQHRDRPHFVATLAPAVAAAIRGEADRRGVALGRVIDLLARDAGLVPAIAIGDVPPKRRTA
jgi:hypothetical protein